MNEQQKHSYSRHILLDEVGVDGQQKLLNATVAVIGLGGLGSAVTTYLAASGVGQMILIDGDKVDQTNLHRQTLFGFGDIGKPKAHCALSILKKHYPDQKFTTHTIYLSPTNAKNLLHEADIVVDCTDNFQTRYLINDVCVQLNKPFVYGALHKFEGQVAVFNLNNGPTYRCLFPELPKESNQPNCSDVGVLGVLPGIIGTMQALEAIKCIVGMRGILSEEILSYHALRNETMKVKMPPRNEEICADIQGNALQKIEIKNCSTITEVSWNALEEVHEFVQIIDVREPYETPEGPKYTTHRISLNSLDSEIHKLKPELPTAVYCQSGKRSLKGANELTNKYQFRHVVSISGGVNALHQKKKTHEELL